MKNSNAYIIASLLRRMAKEIESLNDEQLHDFISNHLGSKERSGSAHASEKSGKRSSEKAHPISSEVLLAARESLEKRGNREDGAAFLRREFKRREDLVQLAKFIDIPVHKRDNADQIVEKLVESTIGFRLRSAVVQGPEKS